MATYTTNYNLEKPDSTDDFGDFRTNYNNNMDIIDQNLGGGGGSGGHTIVDENDQTMTQRTGLQFTGNVEVTDDSVNDKTVVDMPYEVVHLTQAQYDALPNTKLTDGKIYCITDVYSGGSDKLIGLGDCYSTTEKVVGCWTDGKPLYQKTIHITSLPSTTGVFVYYNHNISNLENLAVAKGVLNFNNGNFSILPYVSSSAVNAQIGFNVTDTSIGIMVGSNRSSVSADVTLKYTKTTDTAGSGDWTPSGVPAVHYDGNEKVIGTWFGETLYEKTYVINALPSSAGYQDHSLGLSNIDVKRSFGDLKWASGTTRPFGVIGMDRNSPTSWYMQNQITYTIENNSFIRIIVGTDRSTVSATITIQYTKTS